MAFVGQQHPKQHLVHRISALHQQPGDGTSRKPQRRQQHAASCEQRQRQIQHIRKRNESFTTCPVPHQAHDKRDGEELVHDVVKPRIYASVGIDLRDKGEHKREQHSAGKDEYPVLTAGKKAGKGLGTCFCGYAVLHRVLVICHRHARFLQQTPQQQSDAKHLAYRAQHNQHIGRHVQR